MKTTYVVEKTDDINKKVDNNLRFKTDFKSVFNERAIY